MRKVLRHPPAVYLCGWVPAVSAQRCDKSLNVRLKDGEHLLSVVFIEHVRQLVPEYERYIRHLHTHTQSNQCSRNIRVR